MMNHSQVYLCLHRLQLNFGLNDLRILSSTQDERSCEFSLSYKSFVVILSNFNSSQVLKATRQFAQVLRIVKW